MIGPIDSNDINDARLVAYIDGELSAEDRRVIARALEQNPQLRERLEFLNTGSRPFAEAFDLLLEAAPEHRLRETYAGLLGRDFVRVPISDNVVPLRPAPKRVWSPVWQMAAAAVIGLVVFGGGIATGVLIGQQEHESEVAVQQGWTDAVAQYVSMFSEQTLAGMAADQAAWQRISTSLGMALSRDKFAAIPSIQFRGTQLLQYEGRPLAQIAFQSDTGKPVAICIIRTTRPAETFSYTRRQGLNVVHWITNGYGYIVIGDVPQDVLARISEAARAQLS
jgi:anti-sigma factor RsiW